MPPWILFLYFLAIPLAPIVLMYYVCRAGMRNIAKEERHKQLLVTRQRGKQVLPGVLMEARLNPREEWSVMFKEIYTKRE